VNGANDPRRPPTLLAVPNVSEGREPAAIDAVGSAFLGGPARAGAHARGGSADERLAGPGVRLLDVHFDGDHHRSVCTLAGPPTALADALVRGAREAIERIDVMAGAGEGPRGEHPYVGALDVAPVVYLREEDRGAACAEALVLADRLAHELAVPVFLYGELKGREARETAARAHLRRGGIPGLQARLQTGELRPDFGPARLHPTAGATLVAARPPLVAFNVVLAPPAEIADARRIAALIREAGAEGILGVRAIGVSLAGGIPQVSTNVELPHETPLVRVVEAVARHAPVASAELVGLAPTAALAGFPEQIPLVGFHPERQLIERALGGEPRGGAVG
jgi:glutamate formiminotransferase / 5-formyltetrahydrofolate cyclo-ligase